MVVNSWNSPDSVVKAYSRFVSNVADNAVSAMRLTNNMIFSNMDSWKSVLEQAKDNSRHLSNQNVNAAKTFEQNSREEEQQQLRMQIQTLILKLQSLAQHNNQAIKKSNHSIFPIEK